MTTNRLEAFSDGVLAIVITIMVLEMKAPEGSSFEALRPILPKFISYILSFIYIGIYWNNHHHLFQAIEKVNGSLLWANLFLLFSLSLIPFTTAWMGENNFTSNPVALYGANLLLCSLSFLVLEVTALRLEGRKSKIGRALGARWKELISVAIYIIGVALAGLHSGLSFIAYALVAILWLIPDKRIEKTLED